MPRETAVGKARTLGAGAWQRHAARIRPFVGRRWPWSLGAVVLLALALWILSPSGEETRYRLAEVSRGEVQAEVNATGTLNAVVTVQVGSQLSGQLAEVYVDFNEPVKRGHPLAQVDPETFAARVAEAQAQVEIAEAQARIREAALERARAGQAGAAAKLKVMEARAASAEARLVEAESERNRKQALVKKGSVSARQGEAAEADFQEALATVKEVEHEAQGEQAALDAAASGVRVAEAELANARAEVKRAKAVLRQAEADLRRTMIRSPIDGIVIARSVDQGQTVAASLEARTLFTIARDLREMEVHAKLDEADIGLIRPDQAVSFTVDAFPERRFAGRVVQIRKAPERINNVVTYTVVISAANPDLALLPGMTATAKIVVGEATDVLLMPNAALRFRMPQHDTSGAVAGPAETSDAESLGDRAKGKPGQVWVLGSDGEPIPTAVRVGVADQRMTEIVDGPLGEGDTVVIGVEHGSGG